MGGPTDSSSASGAPLLTDTPPSPMRTNTHPSTDPKGVNTVYLPKTVLALLKPTSVRSRDSVTTTSLLIADSGATDHMLPEKSAFISYYPVLGRRVRMGNNLFAPILGHGTAVISLNGKKILI